MTVTTGDGTRHVIPRWRSLRRTLGAGEFLAATHGILSKVAEAELIEAAAEWRDRGGVSRASEFVGAAIVMGVPDRAHDAAEYLSENCQSEGVRALVNAVLVKSKTLPIEPMTEIDSLASNVWIKIAGLKIVTGRDPRNSIAWLDMARFYTTIGQRDQACRSIFTAVSLAPTNRYVLRSAVAFYSHIGDHSRALELVRQHPAIREDPWLLAADLAATAEARRKQVNVRHARKVLESGQFSDRAMSELASELGTLELSTFASKRAKRHFARAMINPSENAAAQAEWAVQQQPSIQTWADEPPQLGETAARHAERLRDWPGALSQAELWLNDQPFSLEAASYASYIAAISENYTRAIRLAEAGLQANPDSPILINNLAYSLIEIGELKQAEVQLLRVSSEEGEYRAALSATRGLLAIRQGNVEYGIRAYKQSFDAARADKNRPLELQALMMLALELQLLRIDDDDTIKRAVAAGRNSRQPGVQELYERLIKRSELTHL